MAILPRRRVVSHRTWGITGFRRFGQAHSWASDGVHLVSFAARTRYVEPDEGFRNANYALAILAGLTASCWRRPTIPSSPMPSSSIASSRTSSKNTSPTASPPRTFRVPKPCESTGKLLHRTRGRIRQGPGDCRAQGSGRNRVRCADVAASSVRSDTTSRRPRPSIARWHSCAASQQEPALRHLVRGGQPLSNSLGGTGCVSPRLMGRNVPRSVRGIATVRLGDMLMEHGRIAELLRNNKDSKEAEIWNGVFRPTGRSTSQRSKSRRRSAKPTTFRQVGRRVCGREDGRECDGRRNGAAGSSAADPSSPESRCPNSAGIRSTANR